MSDRGGPRDESPYARIAGELRRRIERGELAPGERVPSTREITRRWGVAMATATKALATLREAGLVRAVPGVGTVVDATARPRRGGRPVSRGTRRSVSETTLTSERIVAAAVSVADAEGLSGLSMRRVATEVGAATMSLYRHVADRDELLLRMMDATFREYRLPTDLPSEPRARLEIAARTLWSMFRDHPWLAPALSTNRPQMIPGALSYTEWVLAALDGWGLDLPTRLTMCITLVNYVRGTAVNLESQAEAQATDGLSDEEWMEAQRPTLRSIVASGDFPLFERLDAEGYDHDTDHIFEFGLRHLLDGLATLPRTPPDGTTQNRPAL